MLDRLKERRLMLHRRTSNVDSATDVRRSCRSGPNGSRAADHRRRGANQGICDVHRTAPGHKGTLDMWAIHYVEWLIASGKRPSAGCGVLLGHGVSPPAAGESMRELKWSLPSHAMT